MSEKIIVARRDLTCDLCGRRIGKGLKCRMIHDDFMPGIVYFEHLNCPSAPSAATSKPTPKHPVIYNHKPAMVLA